MAQSVRNEVKENSLRKGKAVFIFYKKQEISISTSFSPYKLSSLPHAKAWKWAQHEDSILHMQIYCKSFLKDFHLCSM